MKATSCDIGFQADNRRYVDIIGLGPGGQPDPPRRDTAVTCCTINTTRRGASSRPQPPLPPQLHCCFSFRRVDRRQRECGRRGWGGLPPPPPADDVSTCSPVHSSFGLRERGEELQLALLYPGSTFLSSDSARSPCCCSEEEKKKFPGHAARHFI